MVKLKNKQKIINKQIIRTKTTDIIAPVTSSVVYESNFDWKKIIKLLFVFLTSLAITLLIVQVMNRFPSLPKFNFKFNFPKTKQKIDFKQNTNIYYFDPINLVNDFSEDTRDYVLVDTRSKDEYQLGHIKEARNVPLYSDFHNMEKTTIKQSDFIKNIYKINKNKAVVLYGYFSRSQLLFDSVQYLNKSGIRAQILSVSWYEFKNNPFSWLPGNDQGVIEINKYLEGKMYENNQ